MITFNRRIGLAAILIAAVLFVGLFTTPVFSQDSVEAVTSFDVDVIQRAVLACREANVGEACAAAGAMQSTDVKLEVGGERVPLGALTDLSTDVNGIAYLRMAAGLPQDSEISATAVLTGGAAVTDLVPDEALPTCTVTNVNPNVIDIFSQQDFESPIAAELPPRQSTTVNGISGDGVWYRTRAGAAPGWVPAEQVTIDCEVSILPSADEDDALAIYTEPFTAFQLQADADASGVFLSAPINEEAYFYVNDVLLTVSGAAFVTTDGDALSVTGLKGQTAVQSGTVTADVPPRTRVTAGAGAITEPDATLTPDDLPALANSLLYGQNPEATISRVELRTAQASAAVGQAVEVDIQLLGDSGTCEVAAPTPVDVVLALDVSPTLTPERASLASAAVQRLLSGLGRADTFALVAFNNRPTVVKRFEDDLSVLEAGESLRSTITNGFAIPEDRRLSSLSAGLTSAVSQLDSIDLDERNQPVIVLVSDSVQFSETAENVTVPEGVRVVTLGYDAAASAEPLAALASAESDAYAVSSVADVPETAENILPALKSPVVARDVTVQFAAGGAFALVDGLDALAGGERSGSVVTWSIPTLYAGQVISLPAAVRADAVDTAPTGEVEVSYLACASGGQRVRGTIPAPTVEVVPSEAALSSVTLVGEGGGTIQPLGTHLRALNTNGDNLATVEITTTTPEGGAALVPLLSNGVQSFAPLYTQAVTGEKPAYTHVFQLTDSASHWLQLQNTDALTPIVYTLNVEGGAVIGGAQELAVNGDPIQDEQVGTLGAVYPLDGVSEGDTITLRLTADEIDPADLTARERIVSPARVISLDGARADVLFTRFDELNNQWVSVQQVRGGSGYLVDVVYGGLYRLSVESGDRLTVDQGAFPLGESEDFDDARSRTRVFSYRLEIPQDQRISIARAVSGGSRLRLLDENRQPVVPASSIRVSGFFTDTFDLPAGDYSVLMESTGRYELNIAPGEVTGRFRGNLSPGETIDDETTADAPLAIYSLDGGVANPLREGEVLTVILTGETDNNRALATADNISISGANGEPAEFIETLRTLTTFRLNGAPPYRVQIEGLTEYELRIERDDLLSVDQGPIFLDQVIRDSTSLPQFVEYELTPQVGKRLIVGDLITLRYEGPYDEDLEDDEQLPLPEVVDKNRSQLSPVDVFTRIDEDDERRTRIAVYELNGTQPFKLRVPNQGSYIVSIDSGNTLELDGGNLLTGEILQGRTSGPQRVVYDFVGEVGEPVTITLSSISGTILRDVILSDSDLRAEVGSIKVYIPLEGESQRLEFVADGTYRIQVEAGDQLTEERGEFYIGDAETVEIEEGPKLVTYQFEITEPQVLSVAFTPGSPFDDYQWRIRPPRGASIDELSRLFAYDDTTRQFIGNRNVYFLNDPGTYEFLIEVQESRFTYTLSLTTEDILTVNKGNFFLNTSEFDTLGRNIRYATYTINADENELLTVEVLMERFRLGRDEIDNTEIEIVNANGESLSVQERLTNFDGQYTLTFLTEGPGPYTMTLQPERSGSELSAFRPHEEYELSVRTGNHLRSDRGRLVQNLEVPGTVEGPARRVVYEIDPRIPEGSTISMRVTRPNSSINQFGDLFDADGNEISPFLRDGISPNITIASYELTGRAPYEYRIDLTGDYTLELFRGDILVQPFGDLTINPAEPEIEVDENGNESEVPPIEAENRLEETAVVAEYTLNGGSGQVVTIQVSQVGRTPEVVLLDTTGEVLIPSNRTFTNTASFYVYELESKDPYRMLVTGTNPTTPHTVRVTDSNLLFAENLAPVPLNPAEPVVTVDDNGNEQVADPLVIENDLQDPAVLAFHPLEVKADALVTLEISQQNRQNVPYAVLTGTGALLEPEIETTLTDGTVRRVYDMEGEAPFRVVLEPDGPYTVRLTDGDQIRTTGAVLPIGLLEEPFSNELEEPYQEVSHRLAPISGRVLTLQLNSQSREVEMTLRNSEGDILEPLVRDFQVGDNYEIYLLSGEPPFTVSFQPPAAYELSALAGNLLVTDQGVVPFEEEVSGRVDRPARAASFTIDARRDQIITTQAAVGGLSTEGELRDANGKLWQPIIQTTSQGRLYNVYLLGGPPPYEFVFNGQTTYSVTVADGDIVTDIRGAVTLGETISERLEAPATVARYLINGEPGQMVSVQLQDNGRPVQPTLYDADGELLIRERSVEKNGNNYSTYVLTGPGPYVVEFPVAGTFNLTVTDGDILTQQLAPVVFGETIRQQLATPAETGIYPINGEPGQLITVEFQANSRPEDSILLAGDGEEIAPLATIDKNNARFNVYQLSGASPYQLRIDTAQAFHVLTVREDNALLANKGVIRFGNTMQDQLEQPQEVAFYTIDGQPGQYISLRLRANGQPLDSELRDAAGNLLQPVDRVIVSGSTYTSYDLTGPAPYQVSFAPTGRYELELQEGDFTLARLGPAPFGSSIRNRLTLPQLTAVYTVNTEPNQEITLTLTDVTRREFLVPEFVDSNGVSVPVRTEIFDQLSRTVIVVYDLTGTSGSYTLRFDATAQYEVRFDRGDITVIEDGNLGQ